MKTTTMKLLGLFGLSALALVTACNSTSSTLEGGKTTNPNDTAGGNSTTFNHTNDPSGAANGSNFQPADPAQIQAVGSPEVTARLHSCGKLSVSSIGTILNSRGMTGNGAGRPDGAKTGMDIYNADDTAAALGGPNYNGRVPEAPFASTSAVSKMFDIFAMSSYDLTDPSWQPPACPGTVLIGADGKFTRDGVSCLIGKPATDDYVAIANQALIDNKDDGAKIAIAALLSAAHTCQ